MDSTARASSIPSVQGALVVEERQRKCEKMLKQFTCGKCNGSHPEQLCKLKTAKWHCSQLSGHVAAAREAKTTLKMSMLIFTLWKLTAITMRVLAF